MMCSSAGNNNTGAAMAPSRAVRGGSSMGTTSLKALNSNKATIGASITQEDSLEEKQSVADENAKQIGVDESGSTMRRSSVLKTITQWVKRSERDAPPVPKKLRLSGDVNEEEEPEQTTAARVSCASHRTSSVNGSASNSQQQRLGRQASSNGSQSTTGSGGVVSGNVFDQAKNYIQYQELRNKLNLTEKTLAATKFRLEESEREKERLIKENRELRRKLEISNPNRSNRGRQLGLKQDSSNSVEDEEADPCEIRVENLDKSTTSKSLMQMIESDGIEVITVRVCRNASTGVLSGYCSFVSTLNATRAIQVLKKHGLSSAIHVTNERQAVSNGGSISGSESALSELWRHS